MRRYKVRWKTCLTKHPFDINTVVAYCYFNAHITAYKIKPHWQIVSLKQINDDLQITQSCVSTRLLFVDENCWQEVGKIKGRSTAGGPCPLQKHHHYMCNRNAALYQNALNILATNSKIKMDIGQLTWRQDSPSLVLCEKSLQPQTGNSSSQADRLVKRADVDALDESEYICSNDSLFTFQTVSVYKMVLVLHVRLFMNSFFFFISVRGG